ncbi:hypothetical protein GCM10025863_09690 [Microbacterium suwonense]|uniref:biotin carboxylase n=1 Tax=Microbacterium suwonense TaxID=683047 RepID=A0ABM8FSA2_9MICO|nr:hypothetical protein GCM10025863_09690 [Microbacterium suwonense]
MLRFDAPRGVRVDAAVQSGSEVTGFYDPMIAKIIAFGPDRETALHRLDDALARTVVLGVDTNLAFLRSLCGQERVIAGDLDTGLIETMLPMAAPQPSERMLAAAAATTPAQEGPRVGEAWHTLPGWRLGGSSVMTSTAFLTDDDEVVQIGLAAANETAPAVTAPGETALGGTAAAIDRDGAVWVSEQGVTMRLRPLSRRARMQRRLDARATAAGPRDPEGRAPMPGSVVAVHVAEGDTVREGEPLVSIEAMKMEHPVLAPHDGTVHLLVALGDQVRRDQPVARVSEQEEA